MEILAKRRNAEGFINIMKEIYYNMPDYNHIPIYIKDREFKRKIREHAEEHGKSVSEITRRLWRKELRENSQ